MLTYLLKVFYLVKYKVKYLTGTIIIFLFSETVTFIHKSTGGEIKPQVRGGAAIGAFQSTSFGSGV